MDVLLLRGNMPLRCQGDEDHQQRNKGVGVLILAISAVRERNGGFFMTYMRVASLT
jgi:hypothetical protein